MSSSIGWTLYAVCGICTLPLWLVMTGLFYEAFVDEIIGYQKKVELIAIVPQMLGFWRFFGMVVLSTLWFIPVIFAIVYEFCWGRKTRDSIPPHIQKAYLWFFLGFGKWKPGRGR